MAEEAESDLGPPHEERNRFHFGVKIMVTFDDPAWRSPATGSTKSQILVMRKKFRASVTYVNSVMVARYIIASENRRIRLLDEAELARIEQEERDNAEPIRKRNA
jgi:hypothetical protein